MKQPKYPSLLERVYNYFPSQLHSSPQEIDRDMEYPSNTVTPVLPKNRHEEKFKSSGQIYVRRDPVDVVLRIIGRSCPLDLMYKVRKNIIVESSFTTLSDLRPETSTVVRGHS